MLPQIKKNIIGTQEISFKFRNSAQPLDIFIGSTLPLSRLSKVVRNLDKRLPLNDSVILATLLDPFTKNLLTMGQGDEMDRLISAINDHVESEAEQTSSPSTSMEIQDSPAAGSHDDESKPLSKRRRLLQKHRFDVPLEDAIRAEITS